MAIRNIPLYIRQTVFLLLISFCSCTLAEEQVHLQLRWHHQFQFAGYYAAVKKGFYKKAGLEVILHEGTPERKPVKQVLEGRAEYGVANAELLLSRLQGSPLVALAAIYQHSPSVLLVRKDANVSSPHDLIGKRVMLMEQAVDADFVAMFNNEGIKLKDIQVLPSSFNIDDLVNHKVDAFNSYLSNEPYYLTQRGVEYVVLNPRNYGVDFYSDILFTSETEIKEHPQRVKAFRQASLEGWNYAMNHPQEIIDLLLKEYAVKKTRAHLEFEAKVIDSLMYPDIVDIGHMNPWRWQQMATTFVQANMVADDHALKGFVYESDFRMDRQKFNHYVFLYTTVAAVMLFLIVCLILAYRTARREVRLRLETEEKIKQIAYRDTLTGLDNRYSLFILAEQVLKMARREQQKVGICFIDLNHFKKINDTLGHKAGDAVLIHVGKVLKAFKRESDIAARNGGDEFILLFSNINSREDIEVLLEKIQQAICQPIPFQNQQLQISASIGISIYPDDSSDIDELIENADSDMYRVKFESKAKQVKTINQTAS